MPPFKKLSREIKREYEKKGLSKGEAERIGRATAAKQGRKELGPREFNRRARLGRLKHQRHRA
jgi:hypothetical protein